MQYSNQHIKHAVYQKGTAQQTRKNIKS